MNVVVSGSHGLVGTAVVHALQLGGHGVRRLVRGPATGRDVTWDIASEYVDESKLGGVDAVVHLAGEGIAARRWSPEQKLRVRDSRVNGTRLLAETLARMERRPAVLVSGSAVGWYGDRGDEMLDEESKPGDDFLAHVCREWERATAPAEEAGIRVVHVRSGIVLSDRGGALQKQLPLFRLGLGGRLGSGRQWVSWISIADEVGAILHALRHDDLRGPVNLTAPNPVVNAAFTAALARAVHRPAVLPVPRAALSVVLGRELAASLLGSQRVQPTRLLESGYRFRYPDLTHALGALLT